MPTYIETVDGHNYEVITDDSTGVTISRRAMDTPTLVPPGSTDSKIRNLLQLFLASGGTFTAAQRDRALALLLIKALGDRDSTI